MCDGEDDGAELDCTTFFGFPSRFLHARDAYMYIVTTRKWYIEFTSSQRMIARRVRCAARWGQPTRDGWGSA